MKKVILALSIFITCVSCDILRGNCPYDGCDRDGQGWVNHWGNSDIPSGQAVKMFDDGKYCSRIHAINDELGN